MEPYEDNESDDDTSADDVLGTYERNKVKINLDDDCDPEQYLSLNKSQISCEESKSSVLATLIWEGRWTQARQRLLSEDFRHEASQEVDLPCFPTGMCDGLPLHLVCSMRPVPPSSFVKLLISSYPEATRIRQKTWGLLPLHLIADLRDNQRTGDPSLAKMDDSNIFENDSEDVPGCTSLSSESSIDSLATFGVDEILDDLANSAMIKSKNVHHREILEMLLQAYPEAVYTPESFHGMLPLHIAASTATSENGVVSETALVVLDLLLKSAPATTRVIDCYGDTPVDLAWREAKFRCHQCGKTDGGKCSCPRLLTVPGHCINPLLREEIHDHVQKREALPSSEESKPIKESEISTAQSKDSVYTEQSKDTVQTETEKVESTTPIQEDKSIARIPIQENGVITKSKAVDAPGLRLGGRDTEIEVARAEKVPEIRRKHTRNSPSVSPVTRGRSPTRRVTKIPPIVEKSSGTSPISSLLFSTHVKPNTSIYRSKMSAFNKIKVENNNNADTLPNSETTITEPKTANSKSSKKLKTRQEKRSNKESSSTPTTNISVPKSAVLKIKLYASDLKRPTNKSVVPSSSKPPNPFFEIIVTQSHGTSVYKSYPFMHQREATWDEAIIDLGVPPSEVSACKIHIRMMHCHRKGGEPSMIGNCTASIDGMRQCGTAHPILEGYEIKGWLRVLSMSIE